MAGWSPSNPESNAWLGVEASFGNGFLDRLEHRQQYKLNGLRQFTLGRHDLTFFGIGYYGFSYVPGLIPITVPAPGDTIDNRQLDRAHTFILVATACGMAPQAITPLLVSYSFEKRPILTSQEASPLISPPKREQYSRFEGV